MASVVTRTTSRNEKRRYVVFHAIDRDTGKERKVWEIVPSGLMEDAKTRKAAIEVALSESGRVWPTEEAVAAASDETINERGEAWLKSIKPEVRDRVYGNYEASLRNHVYPAIGTRRMVKIGPADAKHLRDTMREKGVTDDTIRAALVPLRALVRAWAEDKRVANPLGGLQLFGKGSRRTAGKARRKIKPPESAQITELLELVRAESRDAVLVAAATGLRRGELFGLRWRDIDFETNVISVNAYNYGGVVEDDRFKTDAGERDVPLFRSIRQALLERQMRQRFSGPDDFVFGTTIGTPMDPGNFVKREMNARVAAENKRRAVAEEDPMASVRWHDFRHYAVSVLIKQNADILTLARIAGHSDPSVTLRVYGHLMDDAVSEAAEQYEPLRNVAAAGVGS